MSMRHRLSPILFALVFVATAATANAAPAQTYTRTINKSEAVAPSTRVTVDNLVGHVKITQGGKQLAIRANVVAGGADKAAAKALADSIGLTVSRDGNQLTVHVDYPVKAHDAYQYIPAHPQNGNGLTFLGIHFGGSSSSSLQYQGRKVHVYQGHDRGVPLHVDLVVQLPASIHTTINNHVGRIDARQLDNALTLATDSGDIHVQHLVGRLTTHSDSGDVTVSDVNGTLVLDSDSGDVDIHGADGDTTVNADSGDVLLGAVHGGRLTVDADSGDIRIDGASGSMRLAADSGDIRLKNLGKVPHLHATADSGDIHLSGPLGGLGSFELSADSGDVVLVTSQPPAVHLDIRGSDIRVDWPSVHDVQTGENRYTGDVGKATGEGRITSDDGDVTLRQ